MRFDALGCNGGGIARTPVIDALAASGINYRRAHNQSVVCMPARATIVTGQHVSSHGVWMNGVALPEDQPTIAHWLKRHGYHTALIGKAHFEPWLGSPDQYYENRMAAKGEHGPHFGFDHLELANHFFEGHSHYTLWMKQQPAELMAGFYPMVRNGQQNTEGGGATGAIQVWNNPVDPEFYHTSWVASRPRAWLDTLPADADWFVWMSFPDPHHLWDPPAGELHRVRWQDLPLPRLYPGSADKAAHWLAGKPHHYRGYFDGSLWTNLESPRGFRPCDLTPDQIREIDAMNHIENELIDEACGSVLDYLRQRQWLDDTDVFFTTDHGELQGDFGLLFNGPYHLDALMRVPMIWKPAASAGIAAGVVTRPVGHLDLAATFCHVARIAEPVWNEGKPLPATDQQADLQHRERVITEWDSEHGPVSMHLKSIFRDNWLCTVYRRSSLYDGTEGELYNMLDDPDQRVNRWDDPACRTLREALRADLVESLPVERQPRLPRGAPV